MERYYAVAVLLAALAANFIETVTADDHCDFHCGHYRYCCERNYCCRYGFYSLWYFWFVMVFVILACVLSCGYFRRRQRMMAMQGHARAGIIIVNGQPQQPVMTTTIPPSYNDAVAMPPQYQYGSGYAPQKEGVNFTPAAAPPPYHQAYTFSS